MNRETIIRIVVVSILAMLILFAYPRVLPLLFPPVEKPAPNKTGTSEPAQTQSPPKIEAPQVPGEVPAKTEEKPEQPAVTAGTLRAVGAPEGQAPKPVVLGSAACGSGFDLEAEITPQGSAVRRLTLSKDRFLKTVEDRHLPTCDRAAMDLVPADAPRPALRIAELRVWLQGVTGPLAVDGLSDAVWRVAEADPTRAVLEADVLDAKDRVLLTVRRTYALAKSKAPPGGTAPPAYDMDMRIEFLRADPSVEKVAYVLEGPPPLPREDPRGDQRQAVVGVRGDAGVEIKRSGPEKKEPAEPLTDVGGSRIQWIGEVERYFAVIAIPGKVTDAGFAPQKGDFYAVAAKVFHDEGTDAGKPLWLPGVRLQTREEPLGPEGAVRHDYLVFAGPKDQRLLETYYGGLGLPDLIQWSTCCSFAFLGPLVSLTAWISKMMVMLLDAFHAVVLNYGVAIIVLVILLRIALHPVTRWSTKSMMKMQRLAPKMQELRERYANDKERLNQEMMKFTREEGFSPLSGCLPMFVQMPIWIGLYGALQSAIQLRQAAFLPASWLPQGSVFSTFLQDLAQPDALVRWSTPLQLPGQTIPLLGSVIAWIQGALGTSAGITTFNILPILMAVTMFLQQRLTPTAPTATNQQADQQKKMMGFMMIFMLLLLYNAQAGLCLYIFTSSLLGFAEMRYLRTRYQAAEAAAGAGGGAGVARAEPKPPPPPKKKPLGTSGRDRSIAERLQSWMQKKMDAAKGQEEQKKRK